MRIFRIRFCALLLCVAALTSCGGAEVTGPESEPKPIVITEIVSSAEPIDPDAPLPVFTEHFDEGVTAIYSYVTIQNSETMTGSFPVRMRWFSPNDARPPFAQRVVEMEPGQNIAQFSINNAAGLASGPYMLIARSGKDLYSLSTASGSARFFVGMTPEESEIYLIQEAEAKAEYERRKKEKMEEYKKKEAEEAKNPEDAENSKEVGEASLPPELTSGIEGEE